MAENKSQVWRINIRTQNLLRESVPDSWLRLGGRLLARDGQLFSQNALWLG
jgi:hypothetical protein